MVEATEKMMREANRKRHQAMNLAMIMISLRPVTDRGCD